MIVIEFKTRPARPEYVSRKALVWQFVMWPLMAVDHVLLRQPAGASRPVEAGQRQGPHLSRRRKGQPQGRDPLRSTFEPSDGAEPIGAVGGANRRKAEQPRCKAPGNQHRGLLGSVSRPACIVAAHASAGGEPWPRFNPRPDHSIPPTWASRSCTNMCVVRWPPMYQQYPELFDREAQMANAVDQAQGCPRRRRDDDGRPHAHRPRPRSALHRRSRRRNPACRSSWRPGSTTDPVLLPHAPGLAR